jgi:hypothetical protein
MLVTLTVVVTCFNFHVTCSYFFEIEISVNEASIYHIASSSELTAGRLESGIALM